MNNINMGDIKTGENINVDITNKRNITIQSSGETKNTVDFNGYSFKMNSNDYGVTFKNITLYGRSYFGIVRNAGSYTFDNVDYTGSQLVYTEAGYNSTVNFNGTVNANSVASYVGLNGTTYRTQGGGNQQVLQFRSGTNTINFNEDSTVNLVTTNANVIENGGGTTNINVKKGANVILEPHTQTGMEQFFSVNGIARGIASNATTNLTIDEGANLNISLKDNPDDAYHSSALYLNSGATIKNNGNLTITSDGTPYYKSSGIDAPVYINGTAVINVGNTGNLTLTATNLGTYNGDLMKINGTGTVSLDPHSTFKISGDGTGALTAINLSSGSTFTSDQPKEFTIDLSANTSSGKTLIKNGTINFTRVKNTNVASQYQVALGKVDVTYSSAGALSNSVINSLNKDVPTQVYDYIKSNPSALSFVAAGEDVTLNSLHLDKNNQLTGIATSTGDSKTPIYITVLINNSATGVPEAGMYRLYTDTDGNISTTKVTYAGTPKNPDGSPKPNGGEFSIDLSSLASQLTNDAKITVVASKDFVESPTLTETVEALRQVNIDALQKLVDAAPEEEQKPSYYNASEEAQKSYTDAIAAGQEILDSPTSYDQSDVDRAVSIIQLALTALTGKETDKTALQTAVDQASSVESSDNYTNADARLQDDYQAAIKAGQGILSKENATQTEVDNALTTINNAKAALNGDAKKAASKEALQKAVDEAPTVKSDDAAYYNGSAEAKAAYDNAITAGQTVLDDPDATATQITDALNAINTAKGNLKGEATDKSALQKAVDNSATVKESNNYTNADETQKTAYDNAVTAAQTVLDKTNATQAEVNQALQNLETANNNLNGDAKTEAANKAALEAAVKDAPNVRNTSAYYNGSEEAQTAYNNAINAGQAVLNEANPSASDVKNALDAINAAKDNLKGEATNTEALETALTNANNAKNTGNYTNADQANQEVLNNAITAGQEILKNTNATQADVDNAAKAIIDAINGLNGDTNLTNAKNAATEDIQKALDTKTTDDAIKTAQDKGTTNINNVTVPSLEDAKKAANKAVDDALTAQTEVINKANNLSDAEKKDLIDKATAEANKAKENIATATTNNEAAQAGQAGVDAIKKIVPTSLDTVKSEANKAIDDALTKKLEEINSANDLTTDEKTALTQEANTAADKAKEEITNATTNDAVIEAQNNGVTAIDGIKVPTESAVKEAAKKAVADAATAKNTAIDSSNLTDEEKAALKQEVTDAQRAADQAIDNATTNAAVTEAQTNGVNTINGIEVPTTSATKEQAITDLNTAVDDAKKAIDQDSNLTDEQKQAAKDQIDSDAKTAQDAINNAKTNDDVKKAVDDGKLAIDKDVANAAIDNAVAAKKDEISKSSLTDEEKTALNNEVDQKSQDAKDAINSATTPETVSSAQENGIKNITDTDVPSESAAKQAAKEAVAKAADEKNAAIDSSNLTDEEKAALKQKVTEAQNTADQAIDNATTNAEVTEAQNNGVSAIDDIEVPTTSANKEKAITDLNNEVENAKKAIDQDSNLTDEEKQAVKDQIDSDAQTAKDAINNAKTDNDVNNAVNSGKVAIDKDVANAAIDNAVAGKLKEIQDPLTTEEKQAYTDLINSEATNAKQNIANATTVEEVTTAQTNGVNEITNTEIPTTSSAKEKAIAAINDALQKKTDEINNASNINTQEKTDLINQANEAANAAKNNINNATTNADVDTAQTNGEKAIADVTVPNLSDVKKESIDLINKALDAKTDEINNASNLSQDEKQSLINDATNAATEAINNVNQSQTNDDAKAAATIGVQNIENVTIPTLDDAKKNANQAIDDALSSKVNEINNASNLNDTEKQKLVDQATQAATIAKNNVENATTNDAARDAANAGIDNIKGITFTSLEDAKNAANSAIDNALQVKTDEINNASNLSTDEKQDLINQATEVAKNAKDNINNATTNDAVTEAQNKGITDIANVTVPSLAQVKQDAINAIKQVQDAKNKQISAASNLSTEEQKELSDQVDKIASDAIAQINDSSTTTNDAVTAIRDDAIKQITDLFIPTLDGAQTDAINAIESAKNAKLNDINNAAHLTDEEKQALVDQTNKAADDATKEIKAAQTNDAVKSAETAGLDNINNITIPTLVQKQQEAIEELNAARDAKNSAIDNATDLTTDEKNNLKDKVQAEYSNAVSNITSATTDEAVTTAKENGIAAIKDIEIPTKSAAKEQAITDLNTAVDEAKKAIDQDNNLTDEQKQAAKDQIDSDAKKAQEAIANATTDDEVNTAVDNGKLAIDKDVANAAIDNAVAGKKEEISNSPLTDEEKTALNNEVDQKAQAAKEAVNNAIIPEAVTNAQENGIKNISDTEVPTASTVKEAAKKAVAEAAEAKNNAIDSSNLTDEEKAALKQEVTEAQNAANQAIDNAATNAGVTEAQENGIKAIDNVTVPAESATKEAAKKAIAEAAEAKNNAIDSSNLTDEEKAALKQKVTEAQNAANSAIDNATTNAAVTEAEENGIKAIKAIEVPTKSAAKDQATTDLNNEVEDAKKAVDQDNNLTDEEKQAAKDQIDSDAKKAQDAINNAKTNDGVKKAVDDGKLVINKDVANAAIDNAVAGKKAEISNSPLTDEEKTALNNEVDEKADTAKDAINKATTPEAVTEAQDNGIKSINNIVVPSESVAKEAAKKAVAEVAEAKNNAIDSSNLTDEEKAALKQEVTDAQNAANTAIDSATTNAAVAEAQNNGIDKINSIEISAKSAAKEQATTDLNNKVDEAKKAIDQDNNLTDEQKQAAKDQIDSDAKKAQEAIDNAKNNDDVKKAVDDGKLAIDKDVANAAIDDAAAGKLKEISDSLTDEEKQAYTDLINNEADNAKQKIADSTTPEEVTRDQEEGVKEINNINVPTTSPAKDAANAAIDQALKNKKDEINNATNISSEEKTDLIKQATEAANIAKDNINNATTNSEVETAQVDGEKAIADVTVPGLSDIKKESIDLINKALSEKQEEINNASNLSQDEKQDLIDQAKKVATEAIDEINNAQTNDEAKQAADTGVKNIENISIPSLNDAKNNANQAIDDALNSKKNEISNASNLTDSEKTDLINQATEIANAAKAAINSATTNTAVEAAEDKGVADINNIHFTNLEDSKKAANSAVDDALNTKKDEINNASNLSDSEKAKLINQVTEIAQKAHDAINNATTNSAVTAAENKGIEDIANVTVPSLAETKQAAIDAIKQVQNAKNSQIEEAKNLSTDEQKNLIDQVNKIAQDAINKLNDPATTTNEVITDIRDKAIDQIINLFIPTLDSVQKDAQDAINSAKEAKIDEINKANNLTDQMKQKLIDRVNQVADNATKAINNAQTNDDVKEAETKGLEDIDNIKVPSLVESKDDAIKEIDDALKKKTDEINAADLDQKQKDELISQITDIATETKSKVFNATTNAEVDAEAKAGIKAIEAVKIPARTTNNGNTENHNSATNVTPDHNNAQNTNQVSTNTESESKKQTVTTNSVRPNRNTVSHKKNAPVNKKSTLPQTGKKSNSNLTLAGAALLGLAGVFSLFGLGDKRKKNK